MIKMFANGPGDRVQSQSSHTEISKNDTDTFLLNTHHYKVCIKGKGSNKGKGVAAFPISHRNSY